MPTTQVRAAQPGYDPLASVSIMEQLRSATSEMRMPKRSPIVGHMPVVRQFQVLGVLMVTCLVFGALMLFLDGRSASQAAAAESTATEMQMLSQRLARGTALASQGQAAAFAGLKDSRDRFKADLDALQNGGSVKGVSLDTPSDDTVMKLLQEIRARWDRVDVNAGRVIDNQQSLTTLAKGLDNINQGNNAILELAQQAAQQVGQGGGSLREIEYANQLAVLSQRIAKNANALASGEEIDPEVAFLLGKDAATFRDILNGLLKGSDSLRLSGVKNEEAEQHARRAAEAIHRLRPGCLSDPAEHESARAREAGGARHQQRVRGIAHGHDEARRAIRDRRPRAHRAVARGRALPARARLPGASWARSSSTMPGSARWRARARTSAIRRPFSGS